MAVLTKLSDIAAGDILIADAGFNCIAEGEHIVREWPDHSLYIKCSHGRHHLAAQMNNKYELIGLIKKQVAP